MADRAEEPAPAFGDRAYTPPGDIRGNCDARIPSKFRLPAAGTLGMR
jgi:hypothetical protein